MLFIYLFHFIYFFLLVVMQIPYLGPFESGICPDRLFRLEDFRLHRKGTLLNTKTNTILLNARVLKWLLKQN